ncbi:MAG: peptidase M28, partial [Flavobacterium sp.]
MKQNFLIVLLFVMQLIFSQTDPKIYALIKDVSSKRIESDIRTLANFGTRNTFSDTISSKRGIGAARRWIKSEFEKVSKDCSNCLDVFYQNDFVTTNDGERVPKDTWIVNVVAVQKGTKNSNRYVIMTGDIDSR